MKKTIAIACDPNAQSYKEILIEYIKELGYDVKDFGSEDIIYANTAIKLAEAVVRKEYFRGVVLCGTGLGVSITANKVKGAYAALVTNVYQAERAIKSNNANIIALGTQVTGIELAKIFVKIFFELEFDTESRSAPKVQRICQYEENGK